MAEPAGSSCWPEARSMVEDFTSATLADLNALAKQYLKADRATIARITEEEEKPAKP